MRREDSNKFIHQSGDSFFAPLADAMTIVASIFFIIFLALLFSYKQSVNANQEKNKLMLKQIEDVKKYKMDKAIEYMSIIADNKVARIDKVNKSLILNTEFLFDTGSYQLKEQGKRFIKDKLVEIIEKILDDKEIGNDINIAIEGHSDCQLFERDIYKNWVLSSQRAISVLRELEKWSEDIKNTNRIKAIGYGDRLPSKRNEEEEKIRKECCKIVNMGENKEMKRECVENVLAKDRRAEIRLDYSPEYIEQLGNKYKELVSKFME